MKISEVKECEICGTTHGGRVCYNCANAQRMREAVIRIIDSLASLWPQLPKAFREGCQIDVEAITEGNIPSWQHLAQTLAAERKETTKEVRDA